MLDAFTDFSLILTVTQPKACDFSFSFRKEETVNQRG